MKPIAMALCATMACGLSSAFAAVTERSPEDELLGRLPEIFAKSAAHYKALDAAATPLMKDEQGEFRTPHGWRIAKGELDMRSIYWWTSGHFPGALWYLYEATGDDFLKERATAWTEILAPVATYKDNHDVGFMMYCSYGNARRLLKTDKYDALLMQTASTLCKRHHEGLGLIRSWGKTDEKRDFLVIPDNLMNLELLEWAARESKKGNGKGEKCGGVDFEKIAMSHADVTMKHHYRPDGGCYHVLDYDQETKQVKGIQRGQGASCETAWSRGQSWSIYGYTMMYRSTGYVRYLDFAKKLADYAIGHPNMPADGIPYWDYGAPGEERDSSAGSCMASALLELSQYVGGADRARYRAFAVKQLLALASPGYFSEGNEIGHFLLKHGVGHKPGKSEIDTPLDYGDYYFLEALLRFRELKAREAKPGEIVVDDLIPGGNVKVVSIDQEKGVVNLMPDARADNLWFFTHFRVRGAEGRTVRFLYERNNGVERLTKVGPAVSRDGGKTWRFLNAEKADALPDEFTYAFGPDEKDVRFATSIPYVEANWNAFVGPLKANPRVKLGTLCKSQSGKRENEVLRIVPDDPAKAGWTFVFTCRHHACECSASWVVEGLVQEALADTPEGRWMRANAEVVVVPFVDKDGVEEGDLGKSRKPHDHNQDYLLGRYNSVRAIREIVQEAGKRSRVFFMDNHAPWIRNQEHDHFYSLGAKTGVQEDRWNAWRDEFEKVQAKAALKYERKWDIVWGSPWNSVRDTYLKNNWRMSHAWVMNQPGVYTAFCNEIGYGLCGGVFSEEGAREIGRNMVKAMVRSIARND